MTVSLENIELVEFFTGKNSEGRDFYAYLIVPKELQQDYLDRVEAGQPLDLTQYEILDTGFGTTPHPFHKAKYAAFGFNDRFMDDVNAAIIQHKQGA